MNPDLSSISCSVITKLTRRSVAGIDRILCKWENWGVFIFAALIVSVLTLFVDILYGYSSQALYGDANHYYGMSFEPLGGQESPFMYRVLTPLIVYCIPLDHSMGFFVANTTAMIFAGFAFYYLLRDIGFGRIISLLGMYLLALSPVFIYTLHNFMLTDPLFFLFWIVAFLALNRRDDRLFCVSLFIGVFSKEVMLLAVLVHLFWNLKESAYLTAIKRTLIVGAPAASAYFAFRLIFESANHINAGLILSVLEYFEHSELGYVHVPVYICLTFGVMWIACLIGAKNMSNAFIRSSLIIVPFAFLQILIATDIARVLFMLFPIIIPAGLSILKSAKAGSTILKLAIPAVLFNAAACLLIGWNGFALLAGFYNVAVIALFSAWFFLEPGRMKNSFLDFKRQVLGLGDRFKLGG